MIPPSANQGQNITDIVSGLDHWLDSMRCPGGYGGPVVHWWQDCLNYTGPGLDWRYEGIIFGYLNLWKQTGDPSWLDKAQRAGNDLVDGQLPGGNYRNSQFELNPGTGGTPHEAACDLALLELAQTLRDSGYPGWECFFKTAEKNLKAFCIACLWDETAQYFRDQPAVVCFVPNKSATLVEALFAFSRISEDSGWVERYALPTLQAVLNHQVSSGDLDGAIAQNSFGSQKVEKYFPYYIARCIPGLLQGYAWTGDAQYADAVRRAALFILRWRYADGSFPQVVYPGGQVNRYPRWVAAIADVLRCLEMAREVGIEFDLHTSLRWLMAGRRPDGAFCTAVGFGRAVPGGHRYDARDNLAVVGWNDKVFRYLTGMKSFYTGKERG
jgi:hypothetical protein